jgi:hypothetical protein
MADKPTLVPEQGQDINDRKVWSAADLEDLALALKDAKQTGVLLRDRMERQDGDEQSSNRVSRPARCLPITVGRPHLCKYPVD